MHDFSFLQNTVIILLAAVVVVAIFRRFHLSPVLGYFVAGAAIGEYGWFSFVKSADTEVFGELGIVFLLFAIGLELTFERLKSMRVQVFGFGGLQFLLTFLAIFGCLYFVGISIKTALVISGGFALSSTAIVLQVVSEERKQSTQVGRLSLAVLLMQDLAVVPLLVLVPLLASGGEQSIVPLLTSVMFKAIFVLISIFILGRLLLRPIFRVINYTSSKNNELFIATTLLIVLASAWATEVMGLSLALGAFMAGLLIAETEFHLQAEESINPFKGLFLGLFFMTVGMSFNFTLVLQEWHTIIIISFLLIFAKALIVIALGALFRFNWGTAIHAGLLLSQGGEFAFILFKLASRQGIIPSHTSEILMVVVTVTMALTPLLSIVGNLIAEHLDKKEKMNYQDVNKDVSDLYNHVVVVGFGKVGKMVARLLEAEKVNYIAIDINPNHVIHERKDGFPVYLGDGSNVDILDSVGLKRSKSVIITINNEVTLKRCSKVIRDHMPDIPVIVRAKDLGYERELYKVGVTTIVPETYETGLQMGGAVLKSIGIGENEVSRIKNQFRLGNYVMAQEEDHEESVKIL
jgi:monovalent cation:H+ antiporter-2, CPA2 family